MAPGSPSHALAQSLVFEGGSDHGTYTTTAFSHEELEDESYPEYRVTGENGEQSMYVKLFEHMINDVARHEEHLISKAEMAFLRKFVDLTYKERYLLIRLCLRKSGKWHRQSSLKFESELGSVRKIVCVLRKLCGTEVEESVRKELEREAEKEREQERERQTNRREEREVIDLTLDDIADDNMELQYPTDDEREGTHVSSSVVGEEQPVAGPSNPRTPPVQMEVDSVQIKREESEIMVYSQDTYEDLDTGDLSFFAEDESHAELVELLDCLTTDELKTLAKQMKIKASHRRSTIVAALLSSSSTQTTLSFPVVDKKGKGKHKPKSNSSLKQSTLSSFAIIKKKTQLDRLREMVLKQLGACIRINPAVFTFFRRINLVYFRCTQDTPTILTPSILASCHKRIYPAYKYVRTPNVWLTRAELHAYERALTIEAEIDGLFEGSSPASARARSRSILSATPGPNANPSTTVAERKLRGAAAGDEEKENAEGEEECETAREKDAHVITKKFREVFDEWKALVAVKPEEDCRTPGLERFDAGHVLTRIVHKGADALGWLKKHDEELDVLEQLLAQTRWRRGRRGRWHERRALILTTHMPHTKTYLQRAYDAVVEGLKDPDTHLVYRPKLERRLTTLEKKLQMPLEDRHSIEGRLEKCKNVTLRGERVRTSLVLDKLLRAAKTAGELESPKKGIQSQLVYPVKKAGVKAEKGAASVKLESLEPKGKSQWKGRDDEIVSVEILVLQSYEDEGFKGYHCEGSIVSTLFGLLFWDVIFAPIPGAFETPYQSAPLDIAEDTFFYSRQEHIEKRLRELEEGSARQILQTVDEQHREKKTWCVGVRWDLFPQEDLLQIIDLFNGKALATICRLFCEDYSQRRAGVPDLFLWHTEDKLCKFVEVKGPGDKLQENQKVWIDVLLRAGVPVEHELDSDSNTDTATEPESEEEDELNESQYLDGPSVLTLLNDDPPAAPPPQSSPPSPESSQQQGQGQGQGQGQRKRGQGLGRKRSADESDGLYGPPLPKRVRVVSPGHGSASVSPEKRRLRKRAAVVPDSSQSS
ncbi:hypothetical protein EVG20_g3751 [Dentipellis fragilis]|uniref:Fanconi-associated nuclease n=1 Tax=Dentipellis fragilis TaxID=205917 RepID=A0A4Y9Z3H6_9AGAM|nr:hypothetical protein EVG20_g3751 [Dentipellis fragilis]